MKRVLAAFLTGIMAITGFSVNAAAYSNQSGIITVQDVNGGAIILYCMYLFVAEILCQTRNEKHQIGICY